MKGGNNIYLLLAIFSIGCSTQVVSIYNTDVSNSALKTFRVRPSNNISSMSSENIYLDSLLSNIISTSLAEKGLKISSIPDLYASYMVSVHSSTSDQPNNFNPYSRYNYMDPYFNNYQTRTYKEGVLIIDLKNDRGKLIWQGSKTFKLKTRQSVVELLPELCKEIISSYELGRKE